MTRRLKDPVVVTRPFSIFVEPDNGVWVARLVGFELDHCTQGDTPADALSMAADLMRMLTGQCKEHDREPHDWELSVSAGSHKWKCSRCGDAASDSEIEDVP
jgi:predicted RNase H-like HicB family nuclease